jgi:hypothetical protein
MPPIGRERELGQRSRKRGQRQKPAAQKPAIQKPAATTATAERPSRTEPARRPTSEERNAAVRATLEPFAPGERPWVIKVGALLAFLTGAVQLGLFVAGVKLHVADTRPAAGSTIVFAGLMFACATGMWMMRYWAVLGFMALMALLLLFFSFALIKASSLLGFAIAIAGVCITGFLFFKLVRVLSRLQLPRYPGR